MKDLRSKYESPGFLHLMQKPRAILAWKHPGHTLLEGGQKVGRMHHIYYYKYVCATIRFLRQDSAGFIFANGRKSARMFGRLPFIKTHFMIYFKCIIVQVCLDEKNLKTAQIQN